VIRNVVVGRLRATDDPDQRAVDIAMLHEGLAGIDALQLPGLLAMNVGCDLGTARRRMDFRDHQRLAGCRRLPSLRR
jgi:hypothetical protein